MFWYCRLWFIQKEGRSQAKTREERKKEEEKQEEA